MFKHIKNIKRQLGLICKGRDLDFQDILPREIEMKKYELLKETSEESTLIAFKNINNLPAKISSIQSDYYQEQDTGSKACWKNIVIKLKIGKGNNSIIKKDKHTLDYDATYKEAEFTITFTSNGPPILLNTITDYISKDLTGSIAESRGA